MSYNLIITERAEVHLDSLVQYLLYKIKSRQAAKHLMDSVSSIYDRLEDNPFQFPECNDEYLFYKGYREAALTDMNYTIIFKIEGKDVFVLGVFHKLEQYERKL